MKLFAGVHITHGDPLPLAIQTATRVIMPGPYVLNEPATHAFMLVAHEDGYSYRIEAEFPVAVMRPWGFLSPRPTMLWSLDLLSHVPALARAFAHIGRPYDLAEMLAQLAKIVAMKEMIPGADICTGLVLDVLAAGGRPLPVPDKLPERIARALDAASWAKRSTLL